MVMHTRVEQYQNVMKFDVITSRAFASLKNMVQMTEHLLSTTGRWLAMKGVYPEQEIAELPKHVIVEDIIDLKAPQSLGMRHLVIMKSDLKEIDRG